MFPTHVGIARLRARPYRIWTHVPYACGDCATPISNCGRRTQCSLRMWGLRGLEGQGRGRRQMFPTHVGIARDACRAAHRAYHVPYACGDCAPAGRPGPGPRRCSLRMWGLRGTEGTDRVNENMFPTHVGIARPITPRRTLCLNVPYACGDCARLMPTWACRRQCSLRMWGLRALEPMPSCRFLMFPTHVGIARRVYALRWLGCYVPYACGDCATSTALTDTSSPCSLRMWGLRIPRPHRVQPPAMFPTHVGIARISE